MISMHPLYLLEDPVCDAMVQYYLIEVVLNLMSMPKVPPVDSVSVVIHLNDVDNRIENEEFPLIYPAQKREKEKIDDEFYGKYQVDILPEED